jgi:transposase InsO family protein
LNVEVFLDLADARSKIERWKRDYNQQRPHSSLVERRRNLPRRRCNGHSSFP